MPSRFPLITRCAVLLALLLPTLSVAAAPSVRILEPRPEQVLPGPDVTVRFTVSGACMAECGNNLHFALDDQAFAAQFDPTHPHVLKDVRPGTHTLRVFLANKMHEAIRGTLAVVTFSVAYPDGENRPRMGAPLLTYNLPQGEYLGVDAADIAVDYLVSNVRLSPGGNKVSYYINGRRFMMDDGAPRHLKELPPGYHTVRMELQDANGDLIEGPYNSVERTILVSPDSTIGKTKLPETYPQSLPKISSIKGAMTMGRPWRSVEAPVAMTEAQIQESQRLTVRRNGSAAAGTVGYDDEEELIEVQENVVRPLPPERSVEVEARTGMTVGTRTESEAATVVDARTDNVVVQESATAPNAIAAETNVASRRTSAAALVESPAALGTAGTTTADTATTTTSADARSSAGTTATRLLDNRLERDNDRPSTVTLRMDPPSTSGRSRVRREEGAARGENRERENSTGTEERARNRDAGKLERTNPELRPQIAPSETAQ